MVELYLHSLIRLHGMVLNEIKQRVLRRIFGSRTDDITIWGGETA
jgi:hypothetical protein